MKRYKYKNKKTGEIRYTDKKLSDDKWELLKDTWIRNGMMKSNEVAQK